MRFQEFQNFEILHYFFITKAFVAYHFRKTCSETLRQNIPLYAVYFNYAYLIRAV